MPVITGAMVYPENLLDKLKDLGLSVDALDALTLAQKAGSSKAVNLVLLGRLSNYFKDFSEDEWMAAIEQSVPEKLLEMNKKAFHLGRTA
jgi:indolepyruvate ferredoxin oxidoreductase beta subunit